MYKLTQSRFNFLFELCGSIDGIIQYINETESLYQHITMLIIEGD
jgi:hypothetical protein